MNFFIGCYEICGLIRTYSEELKKQGHSVVTVSDKNPFFDYLYDFELTNLKYNYFNKIIKNVFLRNLFFKTSEIIEKFFLKFRLYIVFYLFIRKIDVYIYIWEGILPDENLFRLLKFFKVKTVVLFLGDEVRVFPAFAQEFDVSLWKFPEEYSKKPILNSVIKLRCAEKYANAIYSVPDQMGLATRPYFHLQIPIYTSEYFFKNNFRKVPHILHLPSEPYLKGSDLIMQVLQELKTEGLQFEIIYKAKIPHQEVKVLLSEVDILLDELILHGPGVLAFEAMASGCAVATNFLEQYIDVFNPPLCAVNYNNIKSKVARLITDYDYRQDLIKKGYEYVAQNNNPAKIVSDILSDIKGGVIHHQYIPKFYKNKFNKPKEYLAIFEKADKIFLN